MDFTFQLLWRRWRPRRLCFPKRCASARARLRRSSPRADFSSITFSFN